MRYAGMPESVVARESSDPDEPFPRAPRPGLAAWSRRPRRVLLGAGTKRTGRARVGATSKFKASPGYARSPADRCRGCRHGQAQEAGGEAAFSLPDVADEDLQDW